MSVLDFWQELADRTLAVTKARETIILAGKVVTVTPLSIQVNEKDVLPESFFEVSPFLRPYKITIPHTHTVKFKGSNVGNPLTTTSTPPMVIINGMLTENSIAGVAGAATEPPIGHSHVLDIDKIPSIETQDVTQESIDIEIFQPLKAGDWVRLLRVNGGQKYLVMYRLEGSQ